MFASGFITRLKKPLDMLDRAFNYHVLIRLVHSSENSTLVHAYRASWIVDITWFYDWITPVFFTLFKPVYFGTIVAVNYFVWISNCFPMWFPSNSLLAALYCVFIRFINRSIISFFIFYRRYSFTGFLILMNYFWVHLITSLITAIIIF